MNDGSAESYAQRIYAARSRFRRLMCSLALVAVVPGVSFMLASLMDDWVDWPPENYENWFNCAFAVLAVGLSLLVWRTLILWTLGRTALSALVGLLPFVQVIYARPLWDAGCVGRPILVLAQGQVGMGLWVWLAVWAWWGTERGLSFRRPVLPQPSRRTAMTPTAKRIVMSMGTIPFSVGVFWIAVMALQDLLNLGEPFIGPVAFGVTAALAVASWVLIWRRQVVWSRQAVFRSSIATVGLLLLPCGGTAFLNDVPSPLDTVLGFLPVLGWGVWMGLTAWIWPQRAGDSEGTMFAPACPACGYLLAGLRSTRCPECGSEPTLDELWAASCPAEV